MLSNLSSSNPKRRGVSRARKPQHSAIKPRSVAVLSDQRFYELSNCVVNSYCTFFVLRFRYWLNMQGLCGYTFVCAMRSSWISTGPLALYMRRSLSECPCVHLFALDCNFVSYLANLTSRRHPQCPACCILKSRPNKRPHENHPAISPKTS